MKTLDQIGIANGTDKATVFTRTYAKPHGYLPHLESIVDELRFASIKLLEVGVGGGESIRTWLEYFPHASVFGVDIVQNTNPWNTPKADTHERYKFMQGDQTDKTMWACFLADCGKDFDVIIDDGSHEPKGIITTFECLWQALKPGGHYVIEDLACGFTNPGYPTHLDWLRVQLELVNQGLGEVDHLYFSRELAVLTKRKLCTNQ